MLRDEEMNLNDTQKDEKREQDRELPGQSERTSKQNQSTH